MGTYASGGNREQMNLLPMCLDDMIAEDNVVRSIKIWCQIPHFSTYYYVCRIDKCQAP